MTTDSERREVARRLREDAKRYLLEGRFCSNEMPHRLAKAVGCRYMGAGPQISELFPRLADLIDPGHDHFADATKMVDRGALLELADEFEDTANELLELVGEAGDDIRPYISNSAEGTLSYARRIREACGVVE